MDFKQGSDNGLIYIYRLSRLLCGAQNRQGKTRARNSCVVVQDREMLAESWLGPRGDGRKHGLGGTLEPKAWNLVTD